MGVTTNVDHSIDNTRNESTRTGWFLSRGTVVAAITLTTVGILLLTGHRAHLLGMAPFLLLLTCLLMHIFMHHGHHNHEHSRAKTAEPLAMPETHGSQTPTEPK